MYSIFQERMKSGNGRAGEFVFANGKSLQTPFYFPVTTLLQSNPLKQPPKIDDLIEQWAIHNRPQLANILYWFDGSQSIEQYRTWRKKGIHQVVRDAGHEHFDAPLFLDSGGFKLRHAHNFDLSKFEIYEESLPYDILQYQLDLGGEIVATLDYPLLGGLVRDEALMRIKRSIEAATKTTHSLFAEGDDAILPFLYVATHGQTAEDHDYYVNRILDEKQLNVPIGFAIGSCVGAPTEVHMSKLISVRQAIPEWARDSIPIHIFGVSGTFMPILAYMGADTFDSFAYAHAAASHDYKHPKTGKMHKVPTLDINKLPCDCYSCKHGLIEAFYKACRKGESLSSDHYSALHLHNYHAELKTLEEYTTALEQDCASEYIADYIREREVSENMISTICDLEPEMSARFGSTSCHI